MSATCIRNARRTFWELRAHIWQNIVDRVKQIPTNNVGILKMSATRIRNARRTFWELRAHIWQNIVDRVKQIPTNNVGIPACH